MFLVIGTKYRVSGDERTPEQIRCSRCGTIANFIEKSGRNYLSLFFVLPIFPLGKTQNFIECPNCKARYNV
jgi:DNA-directed RNA polymerase subunit RPC12/RpoP